MILSITGADNLTDTNELLIFKKERDDVELGILYYLEKQGSPRNPTYDWRKEFMQLNGKNNVSLHLCGESVFRVILNNQLENKETNFSKEFSGASRIQININARKDIFTHEEIHNVYLKLLNFGSRLILQYNEHSKSWILPFLEQYPEYHKNIDILLDSSLGKGIVISEFFIPEELKQYSFKYGFAGGVSVENIQEIHSKVKALGVDYWLDLETGSRTDNVFDLNKAKELHRLINLDPNF